MESNRGKAAREMPLRRPSLRSGWETFASRPLSLVAVLLLAVIVSIVSFGLLALPAVAAYYHVIRSSRRERFFIDLETIVQAAGRFLSGIGKYFLGGYVLGVFGLLLSAVLLVTPVIVIEASDREPTVLALSLQILYLPAFFWVGTVLLHGYPFLVETDDGLGALRYAWSAGRRHFLRSLLVGFLILFPVTGAVFHLLMVFSYPIFVASALAGNEEPEGAALPRPHAGGLGTMYWLLMVLALATGSVLGARFMGGVGVVFWLGLWLVFLLLTRMTGFGYGASIFGFAIGYTAILLGGMTIIARRWGESAAGPWIVFAVIVLVLIVRRFPSVSR